MDKTFGTPPPPIVTFLKFWCDDHIFCLQNIIPRRDSYFNISNFFRKWVHCTNWTSVMRWTHFLKKVYIYVQKGELSCDQFFPNHLELSFDKRTLTREDLLIHEYGSRLLFKKNGWGVVRLKKGDRGVISWGFETRLFDVLTKSVLWQSDTSILNSIIRHFDSSICFDRLMVIRSTA